MKHTKTLMAAALLTASAFAQGPFGVLTSGAPPDAASIVANKVQRLTSLLTLTTAQAGQATSIFTAAQGSITTIEASLSGYRASLQTAVKSNAVSSIDTLSTQIGTAVGQVTALQNKADAAFYAILTADQQTKLNARPSGPGGPGGGRGFGGPGGGRP